MLKEHKRTENFTIAVNGRDLAGVEVTFVGDVPSQPKFNIGSDSVRLPAQRDEYFAVVAALDELGARLFNVGRPIIMKRDENQASQLDTSKARNTSGEDSYF